MDEQLVFGVSDFVAYLNQTLEIAYPYVTIAGELSNFRISKNRWVYFDLKDEGATLRCFATVYALPGPLEDGMTVQVSGNPRLHPQYNFSLNAQQIMPVGEGAIRKAADMLARKLEAEGLFDTERKRLLPYPPRHIALITAGGSAAYADFMKILSARWQGITIDHYDVLVQGEQAPGQIVQAVQAVNILPDPPEVLVLIRGGGSVEDLAAFSTEAVCRAVAGSRVPTLVAIGHEVDVCLSELAADVRASTPSNAAELLVPDKLHMRIRLQEQQRGLSQALERLVVDRQEQVRQTRMQLNVALEAARLRAQQRLLVARQLLEAYNPQAALRRGYALVRAEGVLTNSVHTVRVGGELTVQLADGTLRATVTNIDKQGTHYA